jgi:hypothetical protein
MHILIFLLLVIVIAKLLASAAARNPQQFEHGFRRVGFVVALLAAAFGGFVGCGVPASQAGGLGPLLLAVVGFLLVEITTAVIIWIMRGFRS